MDCRTMALDLVKCGISVIPLTPGEKAPNAMLLPERSWICYQSRVATAEEVEEWFQKEPRTNIGLVCGAISGIVAVDIDGPKGAEWFKKEVFPKPNLIQFTSSMTKYHALYRHPGYEVKPSVDRDKEVDIRGDRSYIAFAPSLHPSGKNYALRELDGFIGWDSLVDFDEVSHHFDGSKKKEKKDLSAGKGERNSSLTSLCARQLAKGATEEEVMCFARGWNEEHCNPPMSDKEVQSVVKSISNTHRRNNPELPELTPMEYTDLILEWAKGEKGFFTVDQLDKDLGFTLPEQKQSRSNAINDLIQDGLIESVGKKRGSYRMKMQTVTPIDLRSAEEQTVPMRLPFGLNNNVKVMPKNVIIVAGETNSGKTAFSLGIARANFENMPIRYISSEMEAGEFRERILNLGDTIEDWDIVDKVLCAQDPHDAIEPNSLNIIDYLEVYNDFWEVGDKIMKIWDSLEKGVAVINVQKKTGAEFARGGEFALEKARLAFSLYSHAKTENGVIGSCKITKAKNVHQGKNPDGREIFYELRNGREYDTRVMQEISPMNQGWHYVGGKDRDFLIGKIKDYVLENSTPNDMKTRQVDFY